MSKIVEKINKLLALAGNNPSEEEAQAALLKAQQLMAEHNVHVEFSDKEEIEYELVYCKHRDNTGFRSPLCAIIAPNFRVKAILINGQACFFGRKEDAHIAKEIFEYTYKFVKREGEKRIKYHREMYGHARNVFNSYANGFLSGLKAVLGQQCTALMIVVPQDVKDEFDNMFDSKNLKNDCRMRQQQIIGEEYRRGYEDSKSAMNRRKLEA